MKIKVTIDNSQHPFCDVRQFEIEEITSVTYATTDGQRVTLEVIEDDEIKVPYDSERHMKLLQDLRNAVSGMK